MAWTDSYSSPSRFKIVSTIFVDESAAALAAAARTSGGRSFRRSASFPGRVPPCRVAEDEIAKAMSAISSGAMALAFGVVNPPGPIEVGRLRSGGGVCCEVSLHVPELLCSIVFAAPVCLDGEGIGPERVPPTGELRWAGEVPFRSFRSPRSELHASSCAVILPVYSVSIVWIFSA